jgi:site-specific recombinase XerC
VHVLLDQRGKTLSHAFVELSTEEHARSALRGAQNSVLGKGKRARGVTVTRSSQEELMRAVWCS